MMIKLKAKDNLILLASSCLVGYLAYELLLTDEAKETLGKSISSVTENVKRISNEIKVDYSKNNSMLDVYETQNEINNEWERIGF